MRNIFSNSDRKWESCREDVMRLAVWKFPVLLGAMSAFALFYGQNGVSLSAVWLFAGVLAVFAVSYVAYRSTVTALCAGVLALVAAVWPLDGFGYGFFLIPWQFFALFALWRMSRSRRKSMNFACVALLAAATGAALIPLWPTAAYPAAAFEACWLAPFAVEFCGWHDYGCGCRLARRLPYAGRWLALVAAMAAVGAGIAMAITGLVNHAPYFSFGIPAFLLLLTGISGWYYMVQWKFELAAWRLLLALAALLGGL